MWRPSSISRRMPSRSGCHAAARCCARRWRRSRVGSDALAAAPRIQASVRARSRSALDHLRVPLERPGPNRGHRRRRALAVKPGSWGGPPDRSRACSRARLSSEAVGLTARSEPERALIAQAFARCHPVRLRNDRAAAGRHRPWSSARLQTWPWSFATTSVALTAACSRVDFPGPPGGTKRRNRAGSSGDREPTTQPTPKRWRNAGSSSRVPNVASRRSGSRASALLLHASMARLEVAHRSRARPVRSVPSGLRSRWTCLSLVRGGNDLSADLSWR